MITCPMRNNNYDGHCESCNERIGCMLEEVLQRLRQLEEAVRQTKDVAIIQD